MAVSEGYIENFKVMMAAAKNGDLALMECTDKATGKPVIAICAVNHVDGTFEFVPIARMFDGNPYDEMEPPSLEDE